MNRRLQHPLLSESKLLAGACWNQMPVLVLFSFRILRMTNLNRRKER